MQCPACYGELIFCKICKHPHCDCSWNDRAQHDDDFDADELGLDPEEEYDA